MDTVDRQTRSKIMGSVGRKNTGPELVLRHRLHRLGLRYRLHDKKLSGRPDIVLPRYCAVIFVHGCFWHAHKRCKYATQPSTRKKFWKEKFRVNRSRDKRNCKELAEGGWRVLVVWECALKSSNAEVLDGVAKAIKSWLDSEASFGEYGAKDVLPIP